MEHVAIMKKEWGLVKKIISGEKLIESRWYKTKRAPFNKINRGDLVFFKETGRGVSVKVDVGRVLQFSDLNSEIVRKIIDKFGGKICCDAVPNFFELVKDKKYCVLIFLRNPRRVKEFDIDKKGFGAMSSWICVEDVEDIKRERIKPNSIS